ncbi:MAG: carboxypeptidase-like regulatory domain-containing protein [bacterium]|jgi:hypothetical protein|uniref:Carboxypeptidase regulatory-like domain-containing protein n=1 Tax=Gimesia chilikensis TaxID=2605989 RepID=A0A517W5B6_9PLAN|nr:carboxypeptidase-like regulatory domain-containing protein [Gimesia chilikensis]MCR9232858.1 carboxypeptidase-like regulatory domain-containing protein [bacterium]QDU00439.1 hypothetical protein V6x_01120 [Gimesia chilikensis]
MTKHTLLLMLSLTLSLFLTACGGAPDDQPELGTVSGVVTMDGTPLPNANVRFYPEAGRASAAKTDDSGTYELIYIRDEMGAVPGKHSVKITTLNEDEDPFGKQGSETVPEKYNKKTTLEATVEPGENTINFDLESK